MAFTAPKVKVIACKACYKPLEPGEKVVCTKCAQKPIGKKYLEAGSAETPVPVPARRRVRAPKTILHDPDSLSFVRGKPVQTGAERAEKARAKVKKYKSPEHNKNKPLNEKELLIIRGLYEYKTATTAAVHLNIHPQTVYWRIRIIKAKLNVKDLRDIVPQALHRGIINP